MSDYLTAALMYWGVVLVVFTLLWKVATWKGEPDANAKQYAEHVKNVARQREESLANTL